MEYKFAYVNRNYFRRARNTETWSLDSNYIKVRVIIRRRKRENYLYLVAEGDKKESDSQLLKDSFISHSLPANGNDSVIFEDSHSFCKKKIPLSIVKDIQVQTKEIKRQSVFQLTVISNNIIAGTKINLYHENFLAIDRLQFEINAHVNPRNIFCDYYEKMFKEKSSCSDEINASRNSVIQFYNNVTLQSIGLCPEYLYVLHINIYRIEIRDINQSPVFTFPLINLLKHGNLNGWFYLEFVIIQKALADRTANSGLLVFESSATGEIKHALEEVKSTKLKKYSSDACLYSSCHKSRESSRGGDFGFSMKQKRSAVQTNSSPIRSKSRAPLIRGLTSPEQPPIKKVPSKLNFFSRISRDSPSHGNSDKRPLGRMWSTGSAESSSEESSASSSASTSKLYEFSRQTELPVLRTVRRHSKSMRVRREKQYVII